MDRNDLQFSKSLGRGWFGWVVKAVITTSSSPNTNTNTLATPLAVVAQMLDEDASPETQVTFVESTRGPRLANCDHVLKVIATCLPHVQLFETCHMGDLKSYLTHMDEDYPTLANSGVIVRFCKEITAGVCALHEVGAVPDDLALRSTQYSNSRFNGQFLLFH